MDELARRGEFVITCRPDGGLILKGSGARLAKRAGKHALKPALQTHPLAARGFGAWREPGIPEGGDEVRSWV